MFINLRLRVRNKGGCSKFLKLQYAIYSSSDNPSGVKVHVCADFIETSNKTLVKWTVSSPVPVNITSCDLICGTEGERIISINGQKNTTIFSLPLTPSRVWTIDVVSYIQDAPAQHSPSMHFIPGKIRRIRAL